MNRRKAISSVLMLLFASGCASPENTSKPVGLLLENNSSETKSVRVSVSEGDVMYDETFEVDGQSKISRGRILEAGRYSVTVSVDGLGEATEEWRMSGCGENDIHAIFKDESIVIGNTCYDD